MRNFFLLFFVFYLSLNTVYAGEVYLCVDRQGVTTIADVPQKGMKCKMTETYRQPTGEEMAQREEEKKQRDVTEKAKKAQDDCYEQVRNKHKEAMNTYCTSRKLPADCVVPPEDMAKLDKYIQEANNRCAQSPVQ